jgi:uncharacterized repeat protein (TIGR01451 family)
MVRDPTANTDETSRGYFIKVANRTVNDTFYGNGRINIFHNTLLQGAPASGSTRGLGVAAAVGSTSGAPQNILSRNNIFMNWDNGWGVMYYPMTTAELYHDYDIYTASITAPNLDPTYLPLEEHGIHLASPQFSQSTLSPGIRYYPEDIVIPENSIATDLGIHLPGFNDYYSGSAPDHGALEKGQCLIFGVSRGCVDLVVTATDTPDPVLINENITYTINVTNNGPVAASGVSLTTGLPAGTSYVSATPSYGSCSGTDTINCNFGAMANGAYVTLTVVARATNAGAKNLTATVSNTESDPDTANNTTTATTAVVAPDLTPTAFTADKQGNKVTVSDTVQNQGDGNAGLFTVAYYISTDAVFDPATDIALVSSPNGSGACTRVVPVLDAGATSSVTDLTCYRPAAMAKDVHYYVLGVIDSANQVVESNETNNVRATGGTIQW